MTNFNIAMSFTDIAITNSMTTIEAKDANVWLIKVEKSFQGQSAVGSVVIKQQTAPDPENSPYVKLAASRAWLALGEAKLSALDVGAAISCAQTGLDELGSDYTSPLTVDDTNLKLLVAQERIQQGYAEDGAKIMLRMLNTRTKLDVNSHLKLS